MKITKQQIRQIILEYEQYVDEDGNVYDDEGNVSRRGGAFGRQYGGQTYTGTRPPWRDKFSRRRASAGQIEEPRKSRIEAIKTAISKKPNNFLSSILTQLQDGRQLSSKQKAVVRKIMSGLSPESESLFESRKPKTRKITKRQLARIVKESLLVEKSFSEEEGRWEYEWEYDADSGIEWTLYQDGEPILNGTEEKNNWPVLGNVALDDALEKFEDANADYFKFENGRAGVAWGEVPGTEAWSKIELDRPEKEDAGDLWSAVDSVRDKIISW